MFSTQRFTKCLLYMKNSLRYKPPNINTLKNNCINSSFGNIGYKEYSDSRNSGNSSKNKNNNNRDENQYKYKYKYSYETNSNNHNKIMMFSASSIYLYEQSKYISSNDNDNDNKKSSIIGQEQEQEQQDYTIKLLYPLDAIREITGNPEEELNFYTITARLIRLGILFIPLMATTPLLLLPGFDEQWWKLLLETIQASGTCWIKFGQWISTRPDLFPEMLCEKFSQLHSQCPSHSYEFTRDTIEKNFNAPIQDLFLYFEQNPMASGSVAQVHKAVTRDGQVVVVKVLHPHVFEYIKNDFAIIYSVVWAFSMIPDMKWLSLPESVLEFGKSMMNQVHLDKEAKHLSKFIDNFAANKEVVFPCPIYPLVSKEVIVETFEPGQPIMEYIKSNNAYNPVLARIGLDAYMQMMLVDNFIHADLHPGNVLVRSKQNVVDFSNISKSILNEIDRRDRLQEKESRLIPFYTRNFKQSKKELPKLIFLDVGLVTQLGPQDKSHFIELFTEVVKGDGKAGAELIIRYAREAQCTEEQIYEFKERLGKVFGEIQGKKISDIHVGHLMSEVLGLVREYHVKIESNFATLVMGTIVLEGLGKQLDPNLSLLKAAIPFLFHRQTSYILPEFFRYLVRPRKPLDEDSDTDTDTSDNNTPTVKDK
ncbi:hypothetical protein CYY_005439 [Polysphondylium violaceum]|uniref:ABC1 atypical kinase-like domain-containing protein n=1 Tax=Polysphondylium violaceum TaxID=133409 RepID=A0A8J4PTR7_9MYCE|nr:hypothetical protein CYY_005439 [Polysphondylium violaceum]